MILSYGTGKAYKIVDLVYITWAFISSQTLTFLSLKNVE